MMKYLKSYPCQYEDINKLPLDVLEDIMIRIGEDPYLNGSDKSELLNLYIEQRWWKKQITIRMLQSRLNFNMQWD